MKLELKHLAGYLAYELKYKCNGVVYYYEHCSTRDFDYENSKPILRPLSDLTKEIEVNGEKFVPMDKIAIYGDIDYLIEQIKTGMVEVIVWGMLLEWHFDIYGLIEKGLAIDKNTL